METVDAAETDDVRRSVQGDSDAYARLVRRHQQAIAQYMWRFTRDRGQWEELVHEVFVEAYFSLGSYRGRAPLLHWLRKIATRVGYRFWKRRARQRAQATVSLQSWEGVSQPAGRLAGQPSDASEAAELVGGLLQRLPPRDRLVLTLFYLEECSVAEIAQRTGWSQTMVKVQSHRARSRLKKLLESHDTAGG